MNYQVLASKWRPKSFSDVVGQEHVVTALENGLSMGRIHHAYLFSGTRGVGKTSIARLLAKGLNCETGVTSKPCDVCDNCCDIKQGRFIDLIEIDGGSRTKVEDTRDLLDNIQYIPARGRFKVYLIDEAHMMSRHSFNALLKTLEEPPTHVKFLLATTDPQKLPVTILSRCLHFHLKALDVEQIYTQLEHILNAENILHETRALYLLARAADGSLRDALSLAEQTIASGAGKLETQTVSTLLGTLDTEQAISLIEALIDANGERTLSLVNAAATRGIEWETLLVEMLALLHRLAMLQLFPSAIGTDTAMFEQRLRKLACTVPPSEIQLYYQTLLIGRKELPFAPDRRMGVEMTLLRALAFHPKASLLSESEGIQKSSSSLGSPMVTMASPSLNPPIPPDHIATSDAINTVLSARQQLKRTPGISKPKKSKPAAAGKARPADNPLLEPVTALLTKVESPLPITAFKSTTSVKKEVDPWKVRRSDEEFKVKMETSKTLKYKKSSLLDAKLSKETIERDPWAAEVNQLKLPKLIKQLALNAWKEQKGNQICLHLRQTHRHLNSPSIKRMLSAELTRFKGTKIELTIIEDDSLSVPTPLEWRQIIYEEKLNLAREAIISDDNIQTLCQFFNANLDEESISPL